MSTNSSILNQMESFVKNEHFVLAGGDLIIDSKFDEEVIDIRLSIEVPKKVFLKTLEKQTTKGLLKYGQTIDDCASDAIDPITNKPYDWGIMQLEEVIDAMIYLLQKEKNEKETKESN